MIISLNGFNRLFHVLEIKYMLWGQNSVFQYYLDGFQCLKFYPHCCKNDALTWGHLTHTIWLRSVIFAWRKVIINTNSTDLSNMRRFSSKSFFEIVPSGGYRYIFYEIMMWKKQREGKQEILGRNNHPLFLILHGLPRKILNQHNFLESSTNSLTLFNLLTFLSILLNTTRCDTTISILFLSLIALCQFDVKRT
jgi:hypothetical protein